jgi:septal ring factor EnvC (AmiA/AmiB activator)
MFALLLAATLCWQDSDTATEIKALRREVAELKADLAKVKAELSDLKEALKAKPVALQEDTETLKKLFVDLANRTGGNDASLAELALDCIKRNKEGVGWTIADNFMKDASSETFTAYKKWRNAALKAKPVALQEDTEALKKDFTDLAKRTGGNDAMLAQSAVDAIQINNSGQGWTIADHLMKQASLETYAAYKEWRNAVLRVKR